MIARRQRIDVTRLSKQRERFLVPIRILTEEIGILLERPGVVRVECNRAPEICLRGFLLASIDFQFRAHEIGFGKSRIKLQRLRGQRCGGPEGSPERLIVESSLREPAGLHVRIRQRGVSRGKLRIERDCRREALDRLLPIRYLPGGHERAPLDEGEIGIQIRRALTNELLRESGVEADA